MKRYSRVLLTCFALIAVTSAATDKSGEKKASPSAPDKAYMQKIWDGWSTLDPANVAQYYASGPHTYFDIAPLKYGSWDEYEKGVKGVLAGYKAAKCSVNDDADIHSYDELVWGTATIKEEMTAKSGKVEMGNFRWTVIWENIDGKWLIVHEHVSEPIQ